MKIQVSNCARWLSYCLKLGISLVLGFWCLELAAGAPRRLSPVVSVGADEKLAYDKDTRGNRIPDFSTVGYACGETEIPNAPIRVMVKPVKNDETARIQSAIDYVAGLPADTNGLRGAVLLLRGRHEISGGLIIANSGVVLRGQGMDGDGTLLVATGQSRRTLVRIVGQRPEAIRTNASWQITDDYVPVGATTFHIASVEGLKAGDSVRIVRPSTKEWIEKLGAADLGGGEGGGWQPGSRNIVWNRKIEGIEGNLVTVDAPITTALEKEFGGGRVETFSSPGRVANVGVENLQLTSTFDAGNPKDENHSWCAITMENTADAWVRQITFKHFAGSAVALYETCQRVTVEDCLSLAPISEDGGYWRNTFFTMGQQTLFLRCYSEHGHHDFAVGHCAAGPNAFVQCESNESLSDSGAIESWSSGTLFDNVRIDGNAISLGYRPGNNASIGWAAANSVLWNCSASVIRCWNPPGARNWSFGSWASFEGDGVWRDSNSSKKPESLYAAQLAERTGRVVELMSRSTKESTNPTIEEAAALIAASREPSPSLSDFIRAAATRYPIPIEQGEAKPVEEISSSSSRGDEAQTPNRKSKIVNHKLSITNGWLVCDGKLLIGAQSSVAWWRGNIRPSEAGEFEPSLTRFVPGRIGRGFTDDLNDVAGWMHDRGAVALDHHYGLWFDRRRDDHERVRRIDGDVLPPFFEQPFARSGQGTAWDGLSKNDLTKFNPWYWSRLREFADICDERGLVLFNNNFFQHNIIEAGAHWVDCPWRTANNINNTGFPEPPFFAGDKRIFMAEQFYDVSNTVRRALYRGFIRQCLDNFTNNNNVIQFTSGEFTGPRHFMEFWLDTVAEWERAHIRSSRGNEAQTSNRQSNESLLTSAATKPIIALAAPKDVQDAILSDTNRAAIVDLIAFRYWWVTDKGLFAPLGGQNLAPRQFLRQWRGGLPNDLNLATMAAEYRAKFPSKPVIAASEQGNDLSRCGWAYVCAGGSMPNLPHTTDAKLLAAIPEMKPWLVDNGNKIWALRDAGEQMLIYRASNEEVDLSAETGSFRVNTVDTKTGAVKPQGTVAAANKVRLPHAQIVWLVKE